MSATSPNPQNLLLLAALGIGTFWFMTRRQAMAAPAYVQPATGQPTGLAALVNGVAALINGSGRAANGMPLLGTVDGRSATQWDVTPSYAPGQQLNNPSAYVSGGVDGLAFNPVNQAPFDAAWGWEQAYGF